MEVLAFPLPTHVLGLLLLLGLPSLPSWSFLALIPPGSCSAFIHQPPAQPVLSAKHQARGWDTEVNGNHPCPQESH